MLTGCWSPLQSLLNVLLLTKYHDVRWFCRLVTNNVTVRLRLLSCKVLAKSAEKKFTKWYFNIFMYLQEMWIKRNWVMKSSSKKAHILRLYVKLWTKSYSSLYTTTNRYLNKDRKVLPLAFHLVAPLVLTLR